MADINERMNEDWKDSTTARERIKEVLLETTDYAGVAAIAEQALTSEPTTRRYLTEFVEEGFGTTAQNGRTTTYKRNEGHVVDEPIEELRATHSQEELIEGIRDTTAQLEAYRDTYGIENPEALVMDLADAYRS